MLIINWTLILVLIIQPSFKGQQGSGNLTLSSIKMFSFISFLLFVYTFEVFLLLEYNGDKDIVCVAMSKKHLKVFQVIWKFKS